MTQLDSGAIETYECFEVTKKPIIFHALGNIESHAKDQMDNGSSMTAGS